MQDTFHVTVLGSGAMGCTYGAMLQDAGCDVLLLDIWQEHIDKLNGDGLTLGHPDGTTTLVPMNAARVDEGPFRPANLVIVFVDTNTLDDAIPQIESLLAEDGYVLTLQNGIGNLEKLASAVGVDRVIAGTSMNSCELLGPGQVRHVIHGMTLIGEIGGEAVSTRVAELGAKLARVDDKTELVADIVPHVWSKLVINCAVNPLCSLTGLLPGELQDVAETRRLQELVVDEIVNLCEKKGIALPEADPIGEVWQKSKGGANKPSMVQHLERGSKTEINALNGAVARMAREVEVSTPVNEAITLMIKGLEKGKGIDIP